MHQIFFPPKSLLIKSRYKRNLLRANNKLLAFRDERLLSLSRIIQNDDHLHSREESEER